MAVRISRADLLAGLTVSAVGLPQCLAYALVAGLPPAYGLVTAALPGLVAAGLGRSPQVVTGPTNTTALLVLAALGPWLGADGLLPETHLGVLATLCLLVGLIRLIAAGLGGARLVNYLPESVLAGFAAGVGARIALMQLDEALGIQGIRGGALVGQLSALVQAVGRQGVLWPAVLVSLGTAGLIAWGRARAPRWPLALLSVLGVAVGAHLAGWSAPQGLPLVSDRAALASGWPTPVLPVLRPSVLRQLLLPAGSIALVGTLELAVTARARGARPDMRRELVAQGAANVAGALGGAFPASASLTRSELMRLSGAPSRRAAALAALASGLLLVFFGDAVGSIAQASLAGVLLVTAWRLANRERLQRMWRAGGGARLLSATTLLATLFLQLHYAIAVGAGLAMLVHLRRTERPRLTWVALDPGGAPRVVTAGDDPKLVLLEISGGLHYAAITPFLSALDADLPPSAEEVIIDLSHAYEPRYAALVTLERLQVRLAEQGCSMRIVGASARFQAFSQRAGTRLHMEPLELLPGAGLRALQRVAGQSRIASPQRDIGSAEERP